MHPMDDAMGFPPQPPQDFDEDGPDFDDAAVDVDIDVEDAVEVDAVPAVEVPPVEPVVLIDGGFAEEADGGPLSIAAFNALDEPARLAVLEDTATELGAPASVLDAIRGVDAEQHDAVYEALTKYDVYARSTYFQLVLGVPHEDTLFGGGFEAGGEADDDVIVLEDDELTHDEFLALDEPARLAVLERSAVEAGAPPALLDAIRAADGNLHGELYTAFSYEDPWTRSTILHMALQVDQEITVFGLEDGDAGGADAGNAGGDAAPVTPVVAPTGVGEPPVAGAGGAVPGDVPAAATAGAGGAAPGDVPAAAPGGSGGAAPGDVPAAAPGGSGGAAPGDVPAAAPGGSGGAAPAGLPGASGPAAPGPAGGPSFAPPAGTGGPDVPANAAAPSVAAPTAAADTAIPDVASVPDFPPNAGDPTDLGLPTPSEDEPLMPPPNTMPEDGFPAMPPVAGDEEAPDLGTLASVSRVLEAAAGTAATVVGGALAGAAAGAASATRRALRDKDGKDGKNAKNDEDGDDEAKPGAGPEAARPE